MSILIQIDDHTGTLDELLEIPELSVELWDAVNATQKPDGLPYVEEVLKNLGRGTIVQSPVELDDDFPEGAIF